MSGIELSTIQSLLLNLERFYGEFRMSKEIHGYVVVEPTVGDLFPIMSLMETEPTTFQMKLAGKCITKDGKPIGESGVKALGIKQYLELMIVVMEVAGFTAPK
jgi:hypothetical protein